MVNRNRLYWSAMGSPHSDDALEKKIKARELFFVALSQMWEARGMNTYEERIKPDALRDAYHMQCVFPSFRLSIEGIEEHAIRTLSDESLLKALK